MSKFSATPWKSNLDKIEDYPAQDVLIKDDYGMNVAVVAVDNPKFRSNLNLLLAAPVLYEALFVCIKAFRGLGLNEVADSCSKMLNRIDDTEKEFADDD